LGEANSIEDARRAAQDHLISGRLDEAEALLRWILTVRPDDADVLEQLADILGGKRRWPDAAAAYRRVLALNPAAIEVRFKLGQTLLDSGEFDDAIAAFEMVLKERSDDGKIAYHLASALSAKNETFASAQMLQRALQLRPDAWWVIETLGHTLRNLGEIDESIACFDRAIVLRPDFHAAHSGRLFTLHFDPRRTPESIFEQHLIWNEQHAKGLGAENRGFANSLQPDRKLRVGYVSPDFRAHSVAIFFLNLLANHDAEQVEAYCYSDAEKPDEFTMRIQHHCRFWRNILKLSDARVAEMIRQDQIDILVDLAGHTLGNRLLVFARKPAPILVTYLGYPNTTGLSAMDYRLTDEVLDPVGESTLKCEELVRLPGSFACYKPPENAPEVSELPADRNGWVTFASFNALSKVNQQTLEVWADILKRVPQSRMVMATRGLSEPSIVQRIVETMKIEPERLRFLGYQSLRDYLLRHREVDLVLDAFPVNGHTVTCHALWMGVPVVCLSGKSFSQRLGASVLSVLGLSELIGHGIEEYANVAVNLANDRGKLSSLRLGLRGRMRESALMDGTGFARGVESAYRQMWRKWCEGSR
jgi:protein O-GlcNAc transferase